MIQTYPYLPKLGGKVTNDMSFKLSTFKLRNRAKLDGNLKKIEKSNTVNRYNLYKKIDVIY